MQGVCAVTAAEKNFYRAKLGEHQRPDEGDIPPLDFLF